MAAYYNEHDKFAAAWLRELISRNLIASGEVDERSIEDVVPSELLGFTQCHFFAGIGVWSYALRRAGWPDDRPVWTGSCPCQPFSAAGKGKGIADERHLWPAFYHLIRQCKPGVVFGEQVASKDGLGWLDIVQADLEAARYSVGAVDLCAAGLGAPHIRQRLYWVADHQSNRRQQWQSDAGWGFIGNGEGQAIRLGRNGAADEMADANVSRFQGWQSGRDCSSQWGAWQGGMGLQGQPGPTNGFWGAADWLQCRDGKWRAVKSGSFPLADRTSGGVGHGGDFVTPEYSEQTAEARVMRLRGYGNAIVAPIAQAFIEAYLEMEGE